MPAKLGRSDPKPRPPLQRPQSERLRWGAREWARTEPERDARVRRDCSRVKRLLVAHYLIHSYRYYVMDAPLVSDACFDWIVGELEVYWKCIAHPHKHLLDRALLKSGFHIPEKDYPEIVRSVAKRALSD